MYFWADGIYSNVRMGDQLCLLVIIGVTEHGHKNWWLSGWPEGVEANGRATDGAAGQRGWTKAPNLP